MSAWAGFWIFMAVFMVCDTYLFSKGYETFFWSHKTQVELQLQQQKLEQAKENQ